MADVDNEIADTQAGGDNSHDNEGPPIVDSPHIEFPMANIPAAITGYLDPSLPTYGGQPVLPRFDAVQTGTSEATSAGPKNNSDGSVQSRGNPPHSSSADTHPQTPRTKRQNQQHHIYVHSPEPHALIAHSGRVFVPGAPGQGTGGNWVFWPHHPGNLPYPPGQGTVDPLDLHPGDPALPTSLQNHLLTLARQGTLCSTMIAHLNMAIEETEAQDEEAA
ncbi:hypothetical protein VTK73DRAFT_7444 [Phialemonium thermophilum]|uniref:Uncharacterized protein n=1 Tax=Phialemonium thermophilum TaxID=223376 RepID=A0ABR3WEL1_9PEZI